MFKIDNMRVDVSIQLDNGIYYFDEQSATGKTRLAKLFRDYAPDIPVSSYSYDDLELEIPFDALVKPKQQKVVVIDRYDLYKGKFVQQIEEFSKYGIVLLDCKGDPGIPCELCFIDMKPDRIEVYD